MLLLDARDLPSLKLHSGDPVKVSLDSHIASGTRASNIIGVLKRGPRWLIVSTPYSGWFTCAGERGPGVALLLRLADWATASDSQYGYLFVANSGHELGFSGARQLLESGLLPAPDDTVAWLHLGASIATPVWRNTPAGLRPDAEISRGRLQMTDEGFRPLLADAFAQIPALTPDTRALVGELLDAKEHGYRGFGLVGGGNIHFHTVPIHR